MKLLLLTISLLISGLSISNAQSNDKAYQAAMHGDYAEALRLWKPQAEKGDAYAQY